MRIIPILSAAALILVSGAAYAGNASISGGQVRWQSTQCQEPAEPPSLLALNSETPASQVNSLMEVYNAYVDQMQRYIDCVGSEGQNDADAASAGIVASAQGQINAAEKKIGALQTTMQSKQ